MMNIYEESTINFWICVGKKDKLLKFFKLVQDGKFPLHDIAFELFLDIVEWFDKDESRQMRYSPSTLQFFGVREKVIWWSIHSVYVWPKK